MLTENDKLPFGKYKGRFIKNVLRENPNYMIWLMEKTDLKFSTEVLNQIKKISLAKPIFEEPLEEHKPIEPEQTDYFGRSLTSGFGHGWFGRDYNLDRESREPNF